MTTPKEDAVSTWPALLAHWMDFARSSLALPKTSEGERWKAAVAPIIGLQAVTYALGDLDRLADDAERPLALDKAETLIRRHAAELHAIWGGAGVAEPLPDALAEMIEDARMAFAAARDGGLEWAAADERLVLDHPAGLIGTLLSRGFAGDLYIAAPGVEMQQTEPVAFVRGPHGSAADPVVCRAIEKFLSGVEEPRRLRCVRQVYRQFDFAKGGPVRDVVGYTDSTLPAGQPLLVAAIVDGEEQPVPLPPRRVIEIDDLPVVFEGDEDDHES